MFVALFHFSGEKYSAMLYDPSKDVVMTDLNDRLSALEIKVAHQDEQLEDLSEMVSKQWKKIEQLGGLLTKADARIESLENSAPGLASGLTDEKPPHY